MFSYFTYGAAFVDQTGDADGIEPRLAAIALTLAPFVFVIAAFVSRDPRAPRDVLRAMGALLVIALGLGLIDPLLGAAAGFAAGGAITIRRPAVDGVVRWRVWAVLVIIAYCLVLLVAIPPAGVFAGAITPLIAIGFADEFAAWRDAVAAEG